MTSSLSRARRFTAVAAATVAAAVGVSACSSSGGGGGKSVSIVAYSVPKPAYDALEKAFAETSQGKGVTFDASYGSSGDQSRAVLNGQKADYVGFSLEPDLTKLVDDGLVDADWNTGPTKGLVSDSVVVLAVRKGNPKGIKGWDDIVKPGVDVVTPDPRSSGGAKWNALAAYAHGLLTGGSEQAGVDYLTKFFASAVAKPESASKATQTFLDGTGDVLVAYENDVIAARQKGESIDYVVPDDTVLIQNPAAVTTTASQSAKDFLAFAESAGAQKYWTSNGFRSVIPGTDPGTVEGANDPANPFPTVAHLTTVADLGGWTDVNKKFFDEDSGLVTNILNG
jgi:sulfate/thiosulfate transport system substrate-binding protein